MKKFIEFNKKNWFIISIICLFIFKLIIVSVQPIYAILAAGYDDRLVVNYANSILGCKWLGQFNYLTFVKGPFTSIFIAISYLIGLPFLTAENIFYALSCILFIYVISKIIKNKSILLFMYIILLFNPILYSVQLLRIYRDNLYSSITLILVACVIGVFLNYKDKLKTMILYMIGAGISISFASISREETIWYIPFIFFIFAITIMFIIFDKNCDNKKKRILTFSIPICIYILVILSICTLNYKCYGKFIVSEYSQKEFKDAYGALDRVVVGEEIDNVPVSNSVRQKLYEVSPKFKELESYYESESGKSWAKLGDPNIDDIEAGWFMWSLIEAANHAGHYSSLNDSLNYYRELSDEINKVCDEGLLESTKFKSTTMSSIKSTEYGELINNAYKTLLLQYNMDDINFKVPATDGYDKLVQDTYLFTKITNNVLGNVDTYKNPFDKIKIHIIELIYNIYKVLNKVMFILAILGYLVMVFIFFYKKTRFKNYKELIILSSLLGLYITRIFMVAYVATVSFESAISSMYLACIYAIEYLFVIFSLTFNYKCVKKYIMKREEK